MPGDRVVIDGLWRCLCPSVDIKALSKPVAFATRRRPALTCPSNGVRAPSPRTFSSLNHCQTQIRHNSPAYSNFQRRERVNYLKRVAKRVPWAPEALLQDDVPLAAELAQHETQSIYIALSELQHVEGAYGGIIRLVEYLVRERGEKPNARLYEYLIRANVDVRGSANVAGQLLNEMVDQGMQIPPQIYEAVLEVTAVHPDYVLRLNVLREMGHRWYTPNSTGLISIVVGLLRDGQHELALEKLEELYMAPVTVPPWLYNVFLYTFGEMGYHQEAFSVLQHQVKIYGPNQSHLSWLFLLEVFSRDDFYSGVAYIWERAVVPGLINPPDGVAMNILNAAARHGDVSMALGVLRMLTRRGRRVYVHHFEALIDAHLRQKDLQKALWVLCIMSKSGLRLDASSTRSIYLFLRETRPGIKKPIEMLRTLKETFDVPVVAFNVILEALGQNDSFALCFDLYRDIRNMCASGPDLSTYNVLLSHCKDMRLARTLFIEMEQLSIQPDLVTFDNMVRISSLQSNYYWAFKYLDMMTAAKPSSIAAVEGEPRKPTDSSRNWWITRDTALSLIKRLMAAEDPRLQDVMERCRAHGLNIDYSVRELIQDEQRQRRRKDDQLRAISAAGEEGKEKGEAADIIPVAPSQYEQNTTTMGKRKARALFGVKHLRRDLAS